MCRKCRRAVRETACEYCGQLFTPTRRGRLYCSRVCYHADQRIWPSEAERYAAKHRARRATAKERPAENYALAEIAERDGFECGLCRKPVDMALPGTARMGPTIDHVTPLAQGGDDTRANVQLAHWICNVKKGAGRGRRRN